VTWGLVQILTLQVMSPRITPSRRRFAKTIDFSEHCELRLYPGIFDEAELARWIHAPDARLGWDDP
jgi:hypothetical protein